MAVKIHIMGASGAGSTTLGQAMAAQLQYPYFDTDYYFWEPSNPPFTTRRSSEERVAMLRNDIAQHPKHIIGGSMIGWGEEWLTAFNLVVFLYVPPAIRLQRLRNREHERYGDVIYTDPERAAAYQEFMDWASGYDVPGNTRRSLAVHEAWLRRVNCPVLEIRAIPP